jgi:RND family efflux transporter MFP subunit
MTEMKKIFVLVAIVALTACGSSGDDSDAIKKKITEYNIEIKGLQSKVAELEKELIASNPNEDMSNKLLSVNVQKVVPRLFKHHFEAGGTVKAEKEAFISPQVNGQITAIYVQEGDRVNKGQILARLDTDVTDNTIQEVKTSLDLARIVYKKQKELWDQNIGSELDYLNAKNRVESLESKLKTLKAQKAMAELIAPINGIVDNILLKVGELASPGRQFMQVVSLTDLYIKAEVSEIYLSKIKKGDTVEVTFPTYPDIKMEVPIARLGNIINPQNRTFVVEVKIKNPDGKLKPNILAILNMNDYTKENAQIVPSVIVKQDMKGKYLYRIKKDGTGFIAEKVYVEVGMSEGDHSMISEGLKPDDRVIVAGYNLVANGVKVRVIN